MTQRTTPLVALQGSRITEKPEILQICLENLPCESFSLGLNTARPISVLWWEKRGRRYGQGLMVTYAKSHKWASITLLLFTVFSEWRNMIWALLIATSVHLPISSLQMLFMDWFPRGGFVDMLNYPMDTFQSHALWLWTLLSVNQLMMQVQIETTSVKYT